ncbi:hypothetical protein HY212_05435 [Candidatus Pacearchaeota archaeon]|nr:hypothetical protein [Candidatus Pacearchaeota archaeon]
MTLAKIIDFVVQEMDEGKINIKVNFANPPSQDEVIEHRVNKRGVVYKKLQELDYLDIKGEPKKDFSTIARIFIEDGKASPTVDYYVFQKPPSAYSPETN